MGDFDEYDYLEKTIENPEFSKEANGVAEKDEEGRKSKRRSEDDEDHQSKRSRGEDEHRSRRPGEKSRDRDRERDREKDRDIERDRDHGRERDRDRDRERDRDGGRVRDRERERHRRDRDRSERERSERERSERERSERDREKDRERERERERERDKERKSRERDRKSKERKEREKEKEKEKETEPEPDPERDQRTVFAYQINLKADERDVYEFFSKAGKVRDVRLIMDRNSRRSKGVGYIEFYDVMSVPMAIALSGQLLLGQPVMVKPSEAEKNLVQPTPIPILGGARRLYVGNLHFNMNEEQLRQVFEPFGTVELVQLPTDPETGQCKGFGFVQYVKLDDARAAQQNLNGLELAGRPIKVTAVTDQTLTPPIDIGPAVTKGELDDDEGGMSLNARSRAELMQKLDRSGATTTAPILPGLAPNLAGSGLSIPGSAGLTAMATLLQQPGLLGLPGGAAGLPGVLSGASTLHSTMSGILPAISGLAIPGLPNPMPTPLVSPLALPSECLLLTNMFDPNEWDEEFEEDLKEDVKDECSKYGNVLHVYADGKSAGHVYVRFDSVAAAAAAQKALHGRWFAGKSVSATFMSLDAYKAKFPDS